MAALADVVQPFGELPLGHVDPPGVEDVLYSSNRATPVAHHILPDREPLARS
jgi:hypothetical protein